MLKAGTKAPDFTLSDAQGNQQRFTAFACELCEEI